MNAWSAAITGFGIGLASLGGLWLTIRLVVGRPHNLAVVALSYAFRAALTAGGLYAVVRESPGLVVPALVGFWFARRLLIGRWGGITDVGT
ncbi:MAG: hypothetical protein HY290_13380 [Planctomycetia bacterium]|nr:hypothetical protein [Planctomycetia bacterium]